MSRIKVQILGNSYYVTSLDSEEHIRALEQQLDSSLKEIMRAKPALSAMDALALLSINLADSVSKAEDAADRMRDELGVYLDEAENAKQALADAAAEIDRLTAESEENQQRMDRLVKQRDDAVSLVASLRDEVFRESAQLTLPGMEPGAAAPDGRGGKGDT